MQSAAPNIRSVTLSSKGQITLSSKARKQLNLSQGTTLMEVVVGNCVFLMPHNRVLTEIMDTAHKELSAAGVTVEELKAEIERQKDKRFAEQYPDLAK